MKKIGTKFFILLILTLFGVQCTFFEREIKMKSLLVEGPVLIDLNEIKQRGYIRAVVENSSTSYYIYRGRRMGYEFELLRNLANTLGVRLHLIIKSDIQEAYELLHTGRADIIAMNLGNSSEKNINASLTQPIGEMSTVLVQNKSADAVDDKRELNDKTVFVQQGTGYKEKLCLLQEQEKINFFIVESGDDKESLVNKVLNKDIDFTIVEKPVALVNATYHDELDVKLEISEKSKVSWAVRKNAPDLLKILDTWIEKRNKSAYFKMLYAKYFLNSKNSYFRSNSTFSSISGNRISQFDELIKVGADDLGWDWRLLASLVYKESRFDTTALSYAGATGLLQLMPVTLERYGVEDPNDPLESLRGGVNYLRYLDKFWSERVPETNERIKFILASYNIGHGHVQDAWKLTLKYGKNIQSWKDVSHYLKLKSDPQFYLDPIVKSGYAKGHLAVSYVEDIMLVYDSYRALVKP